MTGWCMRRIARITSSKSSIERNAIDVLVRPVMFGTEPGSSRSAPEQNERPAPVRTTTRVELSALTSSRARRRGIITSKAIAFIRSGRLSVTSVTHSVGLSTRTNAITHSCSRPRSHDSDRGLPAGGIGAQER